MTLTDLVGHATNKQRFQTLADYVAFCAWYLEFAENQLQARIVSQNEPHYQFFQYRVDGHFNISRPLNTRLMCNAEGFGSMARQFGQIFQQLRDGERPTGDARQILVRTVYTVQQSIGATLDALPSGKSNQARKVNGDLFERFIRLLVLELGIDCLAGTVQVPVRGADGAELFKSSYQHDLLIRSEGELKVIGSVKTSSKDRIDKIFVDKFLYSRLTDTALPHIAIFLNDVQRKQTRQQNRYGISSTFLPGHFKAYTIKLNPLDGVYYCDLRPGMTTDTLLVQHIRTLDHFFYSDLWSLLNQQGQTLEEAHVESEESSDSVSNG